MRGRWPHRSWRRRAGPGREAFGTALAGLGCERGKERSISDKGAVS